MNFSLLWFVSILAATLRLATPLIFASMGGLLSERSGVVNVALEGFMLVGACTGALVAHYTGLVYVAWGSAFVVGLVFAILFALFTIEFKANQIVAGTAFNLFIMGIIPFITKILFNSTGSTPPLGMEARFSQESIFLSPIFFAIVLVFLVHAWINYTASGLWVQFAGEHPASLEASGVSSKKVRWFAVLIGGGFAAWGGATLSIFLASSYSPLMSAGRGFMSLAALIFGRWKPIPTMLACLFFGFTDALQIQFQGVQWNGVTIPVQFIQILPYIITIFAVSGLVGSTKPPKALGKV